MKNSTKIFHSQPKLDTKPLISHDAKIGLLITFLVLIGVAIWVVIELKMYQN